MKKKLTLSISPDEAFAIVNFCERKGRSPLEVLLNACGYQNPEPFLFDIESFVEKRKYLTGKDINDKYPLRKNKEIAHRIWEEIDRPQPKGRPSGGQNEIYLALLSQLLNWNKDKVSAEFEKRHGTRQQYFSKTGDVSQAHWIPNSDPAWYACTQLPAGQKKKILCDLLRDLGFTYAYRYLISELVDNRRPQIAGLRFVSDEVPEKT